MALEKIPLGVQFPLKDAFERVNEIIDAAEKASTDSTEAKATAEQALSNSESTQTQLDQVVINGDSSVEAAQARVDSEGIAHTTLKERLDQEHNEVTAQLAQLTQNVDVTKVVGSNGDFATINEALNYFSKRRLLYTTHGFRARILLQSGFVMREQILVDAIDLGYITIDSEDAEVTISRESLTMAFSTNSDATIIAYPVFGVRRNGRLPIINTLFIMDETGSASWRIGVFVADQSEVYIRPNCGVKNAGHYGLYTINGSKSTAFGANFDDAGDNGVGCFRDSNINFRKGSAKNAGQHGVYLGSSSVVEALEADFSGANGYGAWVYNAGRLAIRDGKLTDCGDSAIYAEHAAFVSAGRTDLSRSGNRGIHAIDGAQVEAHLATIEDCVNEAILTDDSAIVNGRDAIINNNGHSGTTGKNAVEASNGSKVNLKGATVTNNGRNGVFCQLGAEVNLSNASVKGNGDYGVWANRGGKVVASTTDASGNANTGFRVSYGSIISAPSSTGTLSQTANTLTADGVIFK